MFLLANIHVFEIFKEKNINDVYVKLFNWSEKELLDLRHFADRMVSIGKCAEKYKIFVLNDAEETYY